MMFDLHLSTHSPSIVDVIHVLDYLTYVKKPMDYGTIISMLENGEYAPSNGGLEPLEEIVLLVIQDIDLVHQNCLLYNAKGKFSASYQSNICYDYPQIYSLNDWCVHFPFLFRFQVFQSWRSADEQMVR